MMRKNIGIYESLFLYILFIAGASLHATHSVASPSQLESPNGRYIAMPITSNGGVHYQVREKSSGRIVLTTHAQFKEGNDVKTGLFSQDSESFAAAYHYGHKGGYTWVGMWTIGTGFLARSEGFPGFITDLSRVLATPSSDNIISPNGKYEARRVIAKGSVHFEIIERATGRILLLTRAQYKTPNDVKAGIFSENSNQFAAAYHYGHKVKYTWIGIWDIASNSFHELTKSGFLDSIPVSVFLEAVTPPQETAISNISGQCSEGRFNDPSGRPSVQAKFTVYNWHWSRSIEVHARVPTGKTLPGSKDKKFIVSPRKSAEFKSIGFNCEDEWKVYGAVFVD